LHQFLGAKKLQSQKGTKEKIGKAHFVQKICAYNVDEIDTCSQFHQHFMQEFFIQMLFPQLFLVTFWLWEEIRTKNLCLKR